MIVWIAKIIGGWLGIDTTKAQYIVLAGIGLTVLIVVGLLFSWCGSCRERRAEKEKDRINANLANLAANEKGVETEVNQASNQAKNAANQAENARKTDSNKQSNSFTEAKKRYCFEFCDDSACVELKKQGICK